MHGEGFAMEHICLTPRDEAKLFHLTFDTCRLKHPGLISKCLIVKEFLFVMIMALFGYFIF